MKVTIRSHLSTHTTAQDVFDTVLHNRLSIRNKLLAIGDYLSPPQPSSLSLIDFGFEQSYIIRVMDLIWRCHPDHSSNTSPHKPIVVYTDYDADGITGGAVLWETLHTLGFRAFPYTPNRLTEGYGFSKRGLDLVKEKYDPALIVSVDHGIVAEEFVAYASINLGIPVIVTDHHHKQEDKYPISAEAVFHIPALSGSGTAYYVAKEMLSSAPPELKVRLRNKIDDLHALFDTDYVGIAAIGTIADLVPLLGAARNMAYHGLQALTETRRSGLLALKRVADHIGKTVTSYEVGFLLAPRINASGRLEDALDALRLLCTKDENRARALAVKLDGLNRARQDMLKIATDEAVSMVEKMKIGSKDLPKMLFVASGVNGVPAWHEGIIGLIASKICDMYYRPTVVLTTGDAEASDPSEHVLKASCRSISGFHITNFLREKETYLVKFGGHEMAAGFSIRQQLLEHFIAESVVYANEKISDNVLVREITADCELPLRLATMGFAELLEKMAPFGVGNPKPVFVSQGIISEVQRMGKEGKHARCRLIQGVASLELVAFGKAEELLALRATDEPVRVVYTLDINRWQGSERLQGKIVTYT